jgi:hypothetical protein
VSAQSDWVGGSFSPQAKPFKDVRNTRESVAEEKARLCLELGALIKRPPASVVNGSVQSVREWQAARAAAAKVAGSSRSSGQELRTAIGNMRRFDS